MICQVSAHLLFALAHRELELDVPKFPIFVQFLLLLNIPS